MVKDSFTIPLRCWRNATAARRVAFWRTVCGEHHRNGTVIVGREANPESQPSPLFNCPSEVWSHRPSRNELSR
jgi:hypothetical protein